MTPRTRPCTPAIRRGRLQKAKQFAEKADVIEGSMTDDEPADPYVSLCVLAGIAAADVLCCARLGEHAQGESHNEAVALLQKVDKDLAKDLRVLLEMKTLAAYSDRAVSPTKRKQAARAMRRLVDAANAEP